jgi:hypothetical protein
MQGTRRLVAPVGWQPGGSGGIPEQVSGEGQPAAEAAAIGAPAATAVTGNSNTTGLAALQGQSPALNGSGTLICVVDTGECVSVCVCDWDGCPARAVVIVTAAAAAAGLL